MGWYVNEKYIKVLISDIRIKILHKLGIIDLYLHVHYGKGIKWITHYEAKYITDNYEKYLVAIAIIIILIPKLKSLHLFPSWIASYLAFNKWCEIKN